MSGYKEELELSKEDSLFCGGDLRLAKKENGEVILLEVTSTDRELSMSLFKKLTILLLVFSLSMIVTGVIKLLYTENDIALTYLHTVDGLVVSFFILNIIFLLVNNEN